VSTTELEQLRAENSELRRRVELAETAIDELREGALQRRAEVKALAETLPSEISRHALLRAMVTDAARHPDKRGVVRRLVAKIARAPHKVLRTVAHKN
jgi:hypothetical protein